MLNKEEVLSLANEFNLTVDLNDVYIFSDTKEITEKAESGSFNFFVYQKKKGKPTKKVTAGLKIKEGSKFISYIRYAALTSVQDFKELFRKVNSSNFK